MKNNMVVIFDTNVYRTLIDRQGDANIKARMNTIRTAEKKKGIIAKASAVVGYELVSNLSTTRDRVYNSCLKAVKAMALHCANDDGLAIYSLPFNLVAKKYFDSQIFELAELDKYLLCVIYDISKKDEVYNERIIKALSRLMLDSEKTFVNSIKKFIQIDDKTEDWQIKFNSPQNKREYIDFINSDDFSKIIAYALIRAVADHLDFYDENQIDNIVKDYMKQFKIPIIFRKKLMLRFANENYIMDKKNRANYMWDEMILHLANQTTDKGEPIIIVTEDKAMYDTKGNDVRIYKIDEYYKLLGINL